MLPVKCMNERGRLIVRKNSRWIPIKPSPVHRTIVMKTMKINSDQSIKGTSKTSFSGHSAVDYRTLVISKGKDRYSSDYKKNRPNQVIESIQIINLDTLENLAELETKMTINEAYTMAGNRIYFLPMLGEGEETNPFKALDRKYPVDFGVPQEETYIATFSIPKDYTVEDMPKPENISLPNDGGKFMFVCMDENGFLKITSKITLKRAIYTEEEYHSLREFYNRIVSKHAEQVVFKKK